MARAGGRALGPRGDGRRPGEAYLALGLPPGFGEQQRAAARARRTRAGGQTGTTIAGGDVVSAPALTVSFTAVGWAESAA